MILDSEKPNVASLFKRPLGILVCLLAGAVANAHDIPSDVTTHIILKPEGQKLRAAVRVPLKAIRDVDFPDQGNGYLDLPRLQPILPDAAQLWIGGFLDLYEDGRRLPNPRVTATQVSVESDRSFSSWPSALQRLSAPLPENSDRLVWNQVWFDMLLEYPIQSALARFSVQPRFDHLATRVTSSLLFEPPAIPSRAFQFSGDPGLVELNPSWFDATRRFVELGFHHILDGTDHLLFLLCLVIPLRRLRSLLVVVTAFTVAHSITLAASAYHWAPGALWFPPLIETLIAASIVYMAIENIAAGANVTRRWMIAFGFGLVHGFGFSFALENTLQFAGSHLAVSLFAFNLGVELGQVLVLLLAVPIFELLFRRVVAERIGTIIASAFVAHTGWHWLEQRWESLAQYRVQLPVLDAALAASILRWAMLVIAITTAIIVARRWSTQRRKPDQFKRQERAFEEA